MIGEENWRLLLAAARELTSEGRTPFERIDVYRRVWEKHPDRQRGSLDPTFQGMIANAPGGAASAGGTPFRRVAHGSYELRDDRATTHAAEAGVDDEISTVGTATLQQYAPAMLTEDEVKAAVERHLKQKVWDVTVAWDGEHGVDIDARCLTRGFC